jgi:hypothetical protein
MARYIDADKIHEFVDAKVAEGKDGWAKGVPYEWAYALTVIDMQPTADVVPKSEVEKLKKDRYQVLPDGRLELLPRTDIDKIKTGVAKEIFEEIENLAMSKIDADLSVVQLNDTYYIEAIDELKKKYTEDKKYEN